MPFTSGAAHYIELKAAVNTLFCFVFLSISGALPATPI